MSYVWIVCSVFLLISNNSAFSAQSLLKDPIATVADHSSKSLFQTPPTAFSSCSYAEDAGVEPTTEKAKVQRLKEIVKERQTGFPKALQPYRTPNDITLLTYASELVHRAIIEAYEEATRSYQKFFDNAASYDKEVKRLTEAGEKEKLAKLQKLQKLSAMKLAHHTARISCAYTNVIGLAADDKSTVDELLEFTTSTLKTHLKYFLYSQQAADARIKDVEKKIQEQQELIRKKQEERKKKEAEKGKVTEPQALASTGSSNQGTFPPSSMSPNTAEK